MALHPRINVPADPEAIEAVAEGLVRLNEYYFRRAMERGVPVPDLYTSGFVYRRERPGSEWWESAADILGVIADRSGDCEDLAAYLAAWLRVMEGDEGACVRIIRTPRGTFHAITQHGDGTLEDPSRILHYQELDGIYNGE